MALSLTPAAKPSAAVPAPMPTPREAAGIEVTDRALRRRGIPWIPVSGEIHYSRVPRARWGERARQLRAGGVTIASTYVFWLHHVPERGAPRFDGGLDVGAFIDECADAGLDVALRIGPWAHGESRNGGFPDWVQNAPVAHRSDDPAYLELVAEWFGQLAAALAGRVQPGGPVIAIQLENELYDRPEHLLTLKRLARDAGMAAPLWTATAWGGADLPDAEVFPLYGGYGDGFWTEPDAPWDPTFRSHYFFSHVWDDPGVGADVRAAQGFAAASVTQAVASPFPPATCELAGGMATAYHRRPWPSGLDVAAVAHTKIGNGSAWQGYYMYAGGTNPGLDLEESHATGYPNDMTRLSYDFHAPIGQAGDLAESSPLLRGQHAFLDAFGARLVDLPSALPDDLPGSVDDSTTLRWAVRGDADDGFLFVSWHQPHVPLATVEAARFDVGGVVLPEHPVDIPAGTLARWPLGTRIGATRVRWATASALTLLPGLPSGVPTLVLVADAGVPVELAVDGAEARLVEPSLEPLHLDGADLLVLPPGAPVWVRSDAEGERMLLLSEGELAWDDSRVLVRSRSDDVVVRAYDPAARSWRQCDVAPRGAPALEADVAGVRLAGASRVPSDYGFAGDRHSAPSSDAIEELAATYRLELPEWALDPVHDAVVEIDWAGDAGQVRSDGRIVDDRYWDGSRWSLSVADLGLSTSIDVLLLPLAAESTVWLPEAAAERRLRAGAAPLLALDRVRVVSRGPWRGVTLRARAE